MEDELLKNKLENLLKERKWTSESGQDISLIVSTGIPLRLFPFDKVPTILPLSEGITDATWVVHLDVYDELSIIEQDGILEASISVD